MKTKKGGASSSLNLLLQITALAMALLGGRVMAQSEAATRFPDAARVIADYPDPPQAYVVLNLLWDTMHQKSTSPDAVSKRKTYYDASTTIRQRQLIAGDKAATDFDDKTRQLRADRSFIRSVLDKYGVANVAAEPPPQPMRPNDPSDAMIKGAFMKGLPFMIAGLVGMYFVMKVMGEKTIPSEIGDASQLPGDTLPPMPETLRLVKVPGAEYTVGVMSGLVVDKETTMHVNYTTTSTGPRLQTVAGELQSTPGSTTTTATTTQEDTIWLRTPDGGETSWTFTGGSFKTRAGQFISVIARPVPGNKLRFLMAYNHTTKQFERLDLYGAHGRHGGCMFYPISALVGAVGFAMAFNIILKLKPLDTVPGHAWINPLAIYIFAFIVTLFLAFFMSFFVKNKTVFRRNQFFDKEYLPRFRKFLEQRTADLERHYA